MSEQTPDQGRGMTAAEAGRRGAAARAAKLSPERRKEIGRMGAEAKRRKREAEKAKEARP